MRQDKIVADHGAHDIALDFLYFLNFMRGAEPIEEMQERNSSLQGGRVRDERQIHDFLDAVGGQQSKAG